MWAKHTGQLPIAPYWQTGTSPPLPSSLASLSSAPPSTPRLVAITPAAEIGVGRAPFGYAAGCMRCHRLLMTAASRCCCGRCMKACAALLRDCVYSFQEGDYSGHGTRDAACKQPQRAPGCSIQLLPASSPCSRGGAPGDGEQTGRCSRVAAVVQQVHQSPNTSVAAQAGSRWWEGSGRSGMLSKQDTAMFHQRRLVGESVLTPLHGAAQQSWMHATCSNSSNKQRQACMTGQARHAPAAVLCTGSEQAETGAWFNGRNGTAPLLVHPVSTKAEQQAWVRMRYG